MADKLATLFDVVPEELRALTQWVVWQYKSRDGVEKAQKIPYDPHTLKFAKTSDCTTWGTIEEAIAACRRAKMDGVGFMFTKDDPYVGIDLDDCVTHNPFGIEKWAEDIIGQFSSYTEASPSGTGFKIFVKGKLPGNIREGKIEMYDHARYFTVTGRNLKRFSTIEDRQTQLLSLYSHLAEARKGKNETSCDQMKLDDSPEVESMRLSDEVVVDKARASKDGDKFDHLWKGDTLGYDSHSNADLALCSVLAFWSQGDEAQIDRLFRQSGLYRDKWDEVHSSDGLTYGEATIKKALKGNSVYNPNGNASIAENVPAPETPTIQNSAPIILPAESSTSRIFVPELPSEVQVELRRNGGGSFDLLDEFVRHASAIAPQTPTFFHESAFLWLGSLAIARRLVLRMPFGPIFPNLAILWIADTTLFTKTTALAVARSIVSNNLPHLLASPKVTPEALISDLAGYKPANLEQLPDSYQKTWEEGRNFAAQKGLLVDEVSGFFAYMSKDYNAGLIEEMIGLYDCGDTQRLTQKQGLIIVKNSYLTLLGASTLGAMRQHLTNSALWHMGWFPRFALLTPEAEIPGYGVATEGCGTEGVANAIRKLYERLPIPNYPEEPRANSVSIDEDALNLWKKYSKAARYDILVSYPIDSRLRGTYGRLPAQALKVSIILAALEWGGNDTPRIRMHHLVKAIEIVERWRQSDHKVLSNADAMQVDQLRERILRHIQLAGEDGITLRDLAKKITGKGITQDLIQTKLDELVDQGIVVEITPNHERGGRPTTKYKMG